MVLYHLFYQQFVISLLQLGVYPLANIFLNLNLLSTLNLLSFDYVYQYTLFYYF